MDVETVMKQHENLIYQIAKKFYNADLEDLYQAGRIGILKAIKNYKESNAQFGTYAYEYIFGEMYKLASENRAIKLNRKVLQFCKKIEEAKDRLAQKMNRIPTTEEIAVFLNIEPSLIEECIVSSANILSMDHSTEDDNNFYDCIPETNAIQVDDQVDLKTSIETLNPEEQQIINYRYYNDLTQSEVAKKMGMM